MVDQRILAVIQANKRRRHQLAGQVFNYWTVLYYSERKSGHWFCRCCCGTIKEVNVSNLKSGASKSCGCYVQKQHVKHGYLCGGKPLEYFIWVQMKRRCKVNPRYVLKGIKVCERWMLFENFIADMGPRPSQEYSIDRIDNDGNYCPENCRWVTAKEQRHNSSMLIRYVTFNGQTLGIKEWADKFGFKLSTLNARFYRGWSTERVFAPIPGCNSTTSRLF